MGLVTEGLYGMSGSTHMMMAISLSKTCLWRITVTVTVIVTVTWFRG